jgi:PAS domain S-box-containing protein
LTLSRQHELDASAGKARASARCLVVDDDVRVARAIGWMLEERGHQATSVTDAASALEVARDEPIVLALVDIRLADSNGLELIPELRAIVPELPVITMTGHPSTETAATSVRLGAVAYLTKPLAPELLFSAIDRALELQRAQSQLTRRLALLSAQQDSPCQLADPAAAAQVVIRGGEVVFATPRAQHLLSRDGDRGPLVVGHEFPHELTVGTVRTIPIKRPDGRPGTGTIFAQPTKWRGEPAVLVQLEDESAHLSALDHLGRLATAVDAAAEAIVITDASGVIQYVNPAFEAVTGYSAAEAVGRTPALLKSGAHDKGFYARLWSTISGGKIWEGRIRNRRKDGSLLLEEGTISPVLDANGAVSHYVAVKRDITERDKLESQLLRAQKLEGIGQLAAGIAHEINTPTQYISDNTAFLQEAFSRLDRVVEVSHRLLEAASAGEVPAPLLKEARKTFRRAKVDYLQREVPKALEQSMDGLQRVSHIVGAMKDFAHPSQGERTTVDLHHLIDNTLTVSRNEWKYVADVERDFDEAMPPLPCYRDELGQSLLNMFVNAAHAIEEAKREGKGTIKISTRHVDDTAEIVIEDTGAGIPAEKLERVFEPFFTTKPQGKGTGQGLAITHDVVVTKHGGTLDVQSTVGQGTRFVIRLPVETTPCES